MFRSRVFCQVYSMTTVEDLREKSLLLTGYLEWLLIHYFNREANSSSGKYIDIFTPSDPMQRGCQLSISLGPSICVADVFQNLTERGVVVSWRA